MKPIEEKEQVKKIQDIHRRKYLASIQLLPDLHQKKVKEYFQVIFTLIALIFAIVFAINPTISTISTLTRQIQDATQVNSALSQKVSQLRQLSVQYSALQPDFPAIYAAIPQSEEPQTLLSELQALAKSHHLMILSLSAQPDIKQNTKQFNVVTFSLSAGGNYNDIRSFINDSIHFQRVILPTSITISKVTTAGNSSLNVALNGNVYYKL